MPAPRADPFEPTDHQPVPPAPEPSPAPVDPGGNGDAPPTWPDDDPRSAGLPEHPDVQPMPTMPPDGVAPDGGEWRSQTSEWQGTPWLVTWFWFAFPPKTPEQLAAEAARALVDEAAAIRSQLDTTAMQASAAQLATVAGQLKDAAAALDVAQMTAPVNGLTIANFTAMGTDAINATRQSIGQVAAMIQQATSGLADVASANKNLADQNHAQSTALDRIVEASVKTLDSLPSQAVQAAMVAHAGDIDVT